MRHKGCYNSILKVSKNTKGSRISQWKHFCCLYFIPASFVICSSFHDMVTVVHPTNASPCKRGTSSLNNGTRFIAQKLRDHKETLHRTPISSLCVPSLAEVSGTGEFRKKTWNRKTDQQLQSFQLHHYNEFPLQHFSVHRQQNKKKGERVDSVHLTWTLKWDLWSCNDWGVRIYEWPANSNYSPNTRATDKSPFDRSGY